jgi:hypothetical protein
MTASKSDRVLRSIARGVRYAIPLAGQAFAYLWRWAADVVAALRAMVIWYRRRQTPARADDFNGRLAALARAHAARWTAWRALPAQRRFEVRAASLLLIALAVVGGRRYVDRRWPSDQAQTSLRGNAQRANSDRRATIAAAHRDVPEDMAATFRRAVGSARAGTWVAPESLPAVLSPGPLGAWDDFKVGSPVVLEDRTSSVFGSATYRLWYRGCHLLGDYACGIGHAVSKDGLTWDRSPQPVFTPSDLFEREHLDAIAVAHGAGGYVLWYSVSPSWFTGHRRATLKVLQSRDGLAWTPQPALVYESVALAARLKPATTWDGERFHLWLIDSRSSIDPSTGLFPEMKPDGDQMLLHFVSRDGTRLEAAGATPIAPLEMDPATLSIAAVGSEGFRAVFYEQHPIGAQPQGVGVLRSRDGTSWERAKREAMPLAVRDLGSNVVPVSLTLLPAADGLLAWFVVRPDKGGEAIRVAFRKEGT